MNSFVSSGTLEYSGEDKLIVSVDPELARFYRSLIPESFPIQKPRWAAHCTVVRTGKEKPIHIERWGKYQGEVVEFHYDPEVRIDNVYYWLNVWCDRLVEIRTELGLPPKSRWTKPPSGGHQCFHITIGNKKF